MRIYGFIKLFLILSLVSNLSCQGTKKPLYPPESNQIIKTIYVINQGWHTGVIFRYQDVNDSLWPAIEDFSDAKYVEVGWGDADFYQAEENTVWMGIKALFWPTGSVLHVVGFDRPVDQYFYGYDIILIELPDSSYDRLCRFIQQAYETDEEENPIPLGKGLYGNSQFYKARGHYFFTNTCNTWVAQAVREAGYPLRPEYACTAGNLFDQLREIG
ncbi:MAG: DUF2459 domain-containing protein, partial [Aliifodinibius sp.]|nr:DUF2459 domain-containing protein [Fodinibius sp.]NIV15828.1 DUF2459 domain-containing protein [Fodinibius sp.]NIY30061.1 DUF2459 domain-containing protein [Fodinibius sp.]